MSGTSSPTEKSATATNDAAALGGFSNSPEQTLGQLRAELAYQQAQEIIGRGLHGFVDDLQSRLNHAGEAIYETFFAMRRQRESGAEPSSSREGRPRQLVQSQSTTSS